LIVEVDGLPAVCHNLTCDYTYTQPQGQVSSFTFDASTKKLVLTGTDLPDSVDKVRHVKFSLATCVVDPATMSSTNIECTLQKEPTCGDFVPTLTSVLGVVPNSETLVPHTVSCSVNNAAPTTDLNLLGGDNITFSGQYFPHNLETSTVSIKFSDAQQTECVPQISSSSELVCLTSAFNKAASLGASLSASIVINGQTVSNSLTFGMRSETKQGVTIIPDNASPVLKTLIEIKLEDTFPYALDKNDFTVNLTSKTNSTIVKRMNVVSVTESNKTLKCMFGGAESDTFGVSIRHKNNGLLETANLVFTVGSSVTSISPKSGSIRGGTMLTIHGTNFGTEITDNPV